MFHKVLILLTSVIVVFFIMCYVLKKNNVETFQESSNKTVAKICTTPNGCHGWATVDPCNFVDTYNNGFGAINLCGINPN